MQELQRLVLTDASTAVTGSRKHQAQLAEVAQQAA